MRYIFMFAAFVLTCSKAFAQPQDTVVIIPGHALLQTGQLSEYHMKYDFFSRKEGVETKIGGLEDNFTIIEEKNKKLGLRVCNITFGDNTILDSGLCYLKGLKPIYHRSIQTKKRLHLIFSNDTVSGFISNTGEANKKEEQINYHSTVPLFDSYYEDIIAKTLPLKKGLVFKFPEYIYERGGTVWSAGEVAGKQNIQDVKGNMIVGWTIMFYEKGITGETTRTTTYVISEKDRTIILREYKMANNIILMKQRLL